MTMTLGQYKANPLDMVNYDSWLWWLRYTQVLIMFFHDNFMSTDLIYITKVNQQTG